MESATLAPGALPTASVLVIEDVPEVQRVVGRALEDAGYRVFAAGDGDSGLRVLLDNRPDLVILDIGLPGRDGFEVIKDLRARGITTPVLMLTGRGGIADRVEGLDAGADDYIAKPFDYDELLARVRALLRRAQLRAAQHVIRVGDLTIDPLTRKVERGGREIVLTQREYALLEFLARNAGRALTREQISQHVWKQPFDPTTNIVDVYINYLRRKVDGDGATRLVRTVRGVGYMLLAEPIAEH
jgi:DNA-binding response OmpR family regulator